MEENTNPSLWNKNVDDLTVGDAVKINLIILAIPVGVVGVVAAASVVKDKVSTWKFNRAARKLSDNNEE